VKINRTPYPEATVDAFADEHHLVMDVTERAMDPWQASRGLGRYVAHFRHAEVKDGALLVGAYGEGDTESLAIADYARRISHAVLVVDAWSADRREIKVPRLVAAVDPVGAHSVEGQ
jgi:hypothetical protein